MRHASFLIENLIRLIRTSVLCYVHSIAYIMDKYKFDVRSDGIG